MSQFKAVMTFRTMLFPPILKVLFWGILVILIGVSGYMMLINGDVLKGVGLLFFGPVLIRVAFEAMMIQFRQYDVLQEIAKALEPSS
jgi:hypothetical protein